MRSRHVIWTAAGLLVALMLLIVPAADAALDPTDTATGTGALANENGGFFNTADGYFSLFSNTTGTGNVAVGSQALRANTTACCNTAVGDSALESNKSFSNVAVGGAALTTNTTGFGNTGLGGGALYANTTGILNTAVGLAALSDNTTGSDNTALGREAGVTADSANANTTGSDNTFIGYQAGPGSSTQLSNAAAIGANAEVVESNAMVLGGIDANAVNVGIGTTAPRSLLEVGHPSSSYGSYLQLPTVVNGSKPPDADCNSTTFVGRLVLQYDAQKVRTTLWSCSGAGVWTKLAQG
jgi:hypothetical protein